MSYEERLEEYKTGLENSLKSCKEKELEYQQKGDIKAANLFQKSVETIEYQLENLEAAYSMEVIHDVTQATYYDMVGVLNSEDFISHKLGIDLKENQLNKSSYGLHNIEEYRQKLIELSGIKVNVPSLQETLKTYKEILECDMPQQEKMETLKKYECLTGISSSGFTYENGEKGIRTYNSTEALDFIKDIDALQIFYENGLEKGYSK